MPTYYDGLNKQQAEFDRRQRRFRHTHSSDEQDQEQNKQMDSQNLRKPVFMTRAKEIGRDDYFIAFDNGTVLDLETNLIWAAKDNGSRISWKDAKSYCENYRGGGYDDWRMPTTDELRGLHSLEREYKSECGLTLHLTKLIQLTGRAPWASEKDLTSRKDNVAYSFGRSFYGHHRTSSGDRALPVRTNTERY